MACKFYEEVNLPPTGLLKEVMLTEATTSLNHTAATNLTFRHSTVNRGDNIYNRCYRLCLTADGYFNVTTLAVTRFVYCSTPRNKAKQWFQVTARSVTLRLTTLSLLI